MKEKARQEALGFTALLIAKLGKLGMNTRSTEQTLGITNGFLTKNTEW